MKWWIAGNERRRAKACRPRHCFLNKSNIRFRGGGEFIRILASSRCFLDMFCALCRDVAQDVSIVPCLTVSASSVLSCYMSPVRSLSISRPVRMRRAAFRLSKHILVRCKVPFRFRQSPVGGSLWGSSGSLQTHPVSFVVCGGCRVGSGHLFRPCRLDFWALIFSTVQRYDIYSWVCMFLHVPACFSGKYFFTCSRLSNFVTLLHCDM